MLPNQLLELSADLRRLLAAGIQPAAHDRGLRRQEKVFRELAVQIPALSRIAEALQRLRVGDSSESSLLDLIVLVRQAASTLATPDGSGDIEPLAKAGPWFSVCPIPELYRVVGELGAHASISALRNAAEHARAHDLRLIAAVLHNRTASDGELADLIADSILPAFGRAIANDLLQVPEGESATAAARRILALCKIDPSAGLEALRQHDPELGNRVTI